MTGIDLSCNLRNDCFKVVVRFDQSRTSGGYMPSCMGLLLFPLLLAVEGSIMCSDRIVSYEHNVDCLLGSSPEVLNACVQPIPPSSSRAGTAGVGKYLLI